MENMASITPRGSELDESKRQKLKLQLLQSITSETNCDQDFSGDITEWVKIFQALNFNLRLDDQPTKQEGGGAKKGLKIMILCETSGRRVILTNEASACSCNEEKSQETKWEITVTSNSKQSLLETGNSNYPALEPENAWLVKDLMRNVCNIASGKIKMPANGPMFTPSRRRNSLGLSSRRDDAPRLSLNDTPQSPFELSQKYRSLDTLLNENENILPEPGRLMKTSTSTLSDIDTSKNVSYNTANTEVTPTIAVNGSKEQFNTWLKSAYESLGKAIKMVSESSSPFQYRSERTLSSEKNIKSKPATILSKSSPTMGERAANRLKPPTGLKHPAPVVSQSKLPVGGVPVGAIKKTSKYAHIKSTISKLRNESEKKVSK